MPRFRIVLDMDWDGATTGDASDLVEEALATIRDQGVYVEVDELEDMGT